MAEEPEREVPEKEVIVTSDGGGGGGALVAVLLVIVVLVVLFFLFGRGLLDGGTEKIDADIKIDTPSN